MLGIESKDSRFVVYSHSKTFPMEIIVIKSGLSLYGVHIRYWLRFLPKNLRIK